MLETFENFIRGAASVSDEQLAAIMSHAKERHLKRKDFLLRQGEVCRHKTFVVNGLMRSYFVNDDGSESIMRFAAEKTWTLDAQSYNNGTPSRFNIEALEDTQALQWTKESMDELFDRFPTFRAYSEKLKTDNLDATQNRVLVNISYTAEQKYEDFIENYPKIFQRVPLHMVASYLGVSRETLSRIRHAQLKQHK